MDASPPPSDRPSSPGALVASRDAPVGGQAALEAVLAVESPADAGDDDRVGMEVVA